MSAVITPSALLRRPSAAIAPAPARSAAVQITGVLLEDAHIALEPATARAAFTVVIGQDAGNPPIVATRWVGDGPDAAFHAQDRAAQLRAGDVVTVHGDGLRMRYRHDALALIVAHVRDVELQSFGNQRTAP